MFSETWPRSGLMRSGTAFRQPTWAPHTPGTGCSSSPTPAPEVQLWPTPDASEFNDGETLETWEARRQRELAKHRNGNGFGTPLAIAVKLWQPGEAESEGALNPEWVEALMGFPPGWTAIDGPPRLARRTTGSRPAPSAGNSPSEPSG